MDLIRNDYFIHLGIVFENELLNQYYKQLNKE